MMSQKSGARRGCYFKFHDYASDSYINQNMKYQRRNWLGGGVWEGQIASLGVGKAELGDSSF